MMEQETAGFQFNKTSIISLIAFVILLISIPIGTYLIQKTQIFKSRAADNPKKLTDSLKGKADLGIKLMSQYDLNNDGRISLEELKPIINAQVSSSRNKPKNFYEAKGFIIEFKSVPLSSFKKQAKLRTFAEYKQALQKEHQEAKKDILSRLGKESFSSNSKTTAERSKTSVTLLGEYLTLFNGIALDITNEESERVKKSPYVKKIYPNNKAQTYLNDSVPLINAPQVWEISDSQGNKLTGKNIKVGVIDTGIDYTHQDLGSCSTQAFLSNQCSKVAGGYDFINNDNDPIDDNGHGTHVAATIGGNGLTQNGIVLKGVAPEVTLFAYKVLGGNGSGYFSTILSGIERVSDPNQDGDLSDHLDIINLSLGGSGDPTDPLSQAIDRISEIGVLPVVAAGNSGPNEATIISPGNARKALTVGASDKSNRLAYFSSRGPVLTIPGQEFDLGKPDIVAPGVEICAAEFGNWNSSKRCADNKHIAISGTSMATPHVAGLAALIKQKNPTWMPDDIKSVITISSGSIGENYLNEGRGRINALSAVETSTIINPTSLSFGMVNKTSGSWTETKTITIKNAGNISASYSLNTGSIPNGSSIILSENNFQILPNSQKTIQVSLTADNNILSNGVYSGVINVLQSGKTYRIPVLFFKSSMQIIPEPSITNNYLHIKVVTPYLDLIDPPQLTIFSSTGNPISVPMYPYSSFFGSNKTTWFSELIQVNKSTGVRTINASTNELANYNASAQFTVDLDPPVFNITPTVNQNDLNLQITANESISPDYAKTLIDNSGYYSHWMPRILADGQNVYILYQSFTDDTSSDKVDFIKSSDGGYTWGRPKTLRVFTGSFFNFPPISIAKLSGVLYAVLDNTIISSRDEGETWSNPINFTNEPFPYDTNVVDLKASEGKLHLVYTTTDAVGFRPRFINYMSSNDGVNWTQAVRIASSDGPSGDMTASLAVDKGKLRVVYTYNHKVYFAIPQSERLERFGWESKVIAESFNGAFYPTIISRGNDIFIVWGANWDIDFARSSDGGKTWAITRDLTGTNRFDMQPNLAYAGGKLYISWTRDIFNGTFLKVSGDGGKSWDREIALDNQMTFLSTIYGDKDTIHFSWPTAPSIGYPFALVYANNNDLVAKVTYNGTEEILQTRKLTNYWSTQTPLRGNGIYDIEVLGRDIAGNVGRTTASFTYNTSASPTPRPTITSPSPTLTPTPTLTPAPSPISSVKRIFVTSTTYQGNLGGLSGADNKCQQIAESASLGGIWKAWLSTPGTSALSRIVHGNDYYKLVNGTVIANNWNDLTDGSLLAPINVTESGVNLDTTVWTNTLPDGYQEPFSCGDWTSVSSGINGVIGKSSETSAYWSDFDRAYCSSSNSLYCFEQ
ncbi:MAG: Peptidase S8 and S53 subtilisin kexin sedolisin [uncultured bacterium]|uniref:EF-hand domain-containing protein n=1 Tax=Candidatus Daviesbacteria bacterium GW2011_GWC2_40_12 TaxID=1618431 RepID=A0A0G0TUX7_9BACT|nr:MAG: Peptidase S8 and S53 subtilisin kexin sedolisin [uncultured bacterium]KKQ85234.1 MAG: hypothetical protein UT04_C0006G0005 [Candidatus Daviesbacteria bacterium GW2011_GWF2_38_7]KKR17505.1 MAG: hypothetical protein UT45_C0001G0180 [Candidatus Daviesbacteria bacterium GW2011_GWA2_39_33]KKR25010.1 MAG: hypothetical protein UT54_C0008G0005 [Candidatus Daviesbacteria bacterium GW2011_GWB1_39_5]KKR41702.1 MAG: hypothetical protein UT77_C0007G0004 [Candidatus Daviesbacteria bacterium GW2011_GW